MPQRKKAKSKENKTTPTDSAGGTEGIQPSEMDPGVGNSTDSKWEVASSTFSSCELDPLPDGEEGSRMCH